MADNKLQSLTELFNEKFFRIPDFQRWYSWKTKQLEDFRNDLLNLKEGKIHYTGLLTIDSATKEDIDKSDDNNNDGWLIERWFKAYYLIDWQQRLTTSIVLINEILEQLSENEEINFEDKSYWTNKFLFKKYKSNNYYIFGYETDNPSYEYFKTKILWQEWFMSGVPDQTLYTSNLKNAKDFFKNKISKLDKKEIEILFKKLTSKFKFNIYEIDDELDVYITFETMNNR